MEKLLKDFYNGNLIPIEQCRSEIKKKKQLYKEQYKHYENFIEKIGREFEEEFNVILDEQFDTINSEVEEAFCYGFRIGVKMMLEVCQSE
ncbi:DUF6809 family protein [Clostridium sp. MD294]|uniref:DUF6809 family protein n=1 Tax=Clostridium sp. MD294 TaxID=97138 RepID=UPI0002CC3772|nr:DUF6809 family protein [Clostridium sp. MD294]NDO46597.1 hypothetical protein [Clostridium sp. MD294]USF28971.1 hypothetical protein C820_000354 [Clostridium sp. MD294]